MSKRTNPPGRVVIVHGGDGDVDDAAGAVKRFLEGVITHVLIHHLSSKVERRVIRG